MITRGEITGVILCGGDARRMFGVEKPLQLMDGEPLVAHVRARVSPQVAQVVISANREHDAYAVWGDPVVSDDITTWSWTSLNDLVDEPLSWAEYILMTHDGLVIPAQVALDPDFATTERRIFVAA